MWHLGLYIFKINYFIPFQKKLKVKWSSVIIQFQCILRYFQPITSNINLTNQNFLGMGLGNWYFKNLTGVSDRLKFEDVFSGKPAAQDFRRVQRVIETHIWNIPVKSLQKEVKTIISMGHMIILTNRSWTFGFLSSRHLWWEDGDQS